MPQARQLVLQAEPGNRAKGKGEEEEEDDDAEEDVGGDTKMGEVCSMSTGVCGTLRGR